MNLTGKFEGRKKGDMNKKLNRVSSQTKAVTAARVHAMRMEKNFLFSLQARMRDELSRIEERLLDLENGITGEKASVK